SGCSAPSPPRSEQLLAGISYRTRKPPGKLLDLCARTVTRSAFLLPSKRSRLEQTAQDDRASDQEHEHEARRDRDPPQVRTEIGDPLHGDGGILRGQWASLLPAAWAPRQGPCSGCRAGGGRWRDLGRLSWLRYLARLRSGSRRHPGRPG